MTRILAVAWREFSSTAMTKSFIIGAIIVPLISLAVIPLVIFLVLNTKTPKIEGSVAVIDRTGRVVPLVRENLTPEALARRQARQLKAAQQLTAMAAEKFGADPHDFSQSADLIKQLTPDAPVLTIEELPPDADVEAIKVRIREEAAGKHPSKPGDGPDQPKNGAGEPERSARDRGLLVIVEIAPDAVVKGADAAVFGGFRLFVRPRLDERVIDAVRDAVEEAVLTTRIEASGMRVEEVQALAKVVEGRTQEVTEGGERSSTEKIAQFLPIGFLILLILSVMVGGQYLVTTTIEEKSNRVVEVLLSAVSSKQLMTGKILGQMFVGLVMLVMYSGLGMGGMVAFNIMHLLDAITVVYFIVYFVIAYLLFAATLAAVGSAVNDLREAQSLQTPVMLCLIIPYFLWFPIARDPNSWFAIILSMVPPISPFVMILRITSTEPPPTWQVLLSIAIGFVTVYFAIWAAAKIFRVGLLMYGKPPNFATLIRWVRMA